MTIGELKKRIENVPDELDITVNLAPSGHVSCCGTEKITDAHRGFDWEHGQFVLYTERPVDIWYDKCKNCGIIDDGRVTSKLICKDINTWEHELVVKVDGENRLRVTYTKDELLRKNEN